MITVFFISNQFKFSIVHNSACPSNIFFKIFLDISRLTALWRVFAAGFTAGINPIKNPHVGPNTMPPAVTLAWLI